MKVDFHTHFYTDAYLSALGSGQYRANLVQDTGGNRRLQFAGDYSLIMPAHVQPERVIQAMDAHGVDRQLLSFSVPGLQVEEARDGVRLAHIVNDALADVISQYPQRLSALAALPLQDAAASASELSRAVTQLGLQGGLLFSNINGEQLSNRVYWPLYGAAEELDVPLFIHPINPVNVDGMRHFRLVPMAGFLFDTSLAALNLVFHGVMATFPRLKIVLGNLGGTIPYIAGRVDHGFASYPEARGALDQPPSTYLKRMYYDTAGMPDAGALQMAINFAGAGHILFGSDVPQQIGDVAQAMRMIDDLPIDQVDKALIFGDNARRLLTRNPA